LALAACASQESDAQACAGYGYQPGTGAFADCMMQRDVRRRVAYAGAMQGMSDHFYRQAELQTPLTVQCYGC
jgi:hypothetical protein